jgi:hypothetical protein
LLREASRALRFRQMWDYRRVVWDTVV